MATAVLRTPTFRASPPPLLSTTTNSFKSPKLLTLSFSRRHRQTCPYRCRIHYSPPPLSSHKISRRLLKFLPFASFDETIETDQKEEVQEPQLQDNSDGAGGDSTDTEEPASGILSSLQSYKEALASNNESKVAEIEVLLKSIEDEKIVLERTLATLSEELSYERDRILRISADFDNFRKRTERERVSLVTNAQGEVVENLLPVLDNFERAKAQIKAETNGEEKISNSYQSIYKQFVEILASLGVVPVETIGIPFDPMLHEAIMREDSAEFEEGIVLQEFRKGFQLGDRLLRPSMVKVSAGPGPAKPESVVQPEEPPVINEISEAAGVEAAAAAAAEDL